ncbi:uncharacterized protein LOC111643025 [Copidosoma floridanum]|uniref:uncharacterized protein LOC111643025 n=1 Tax=Copidosoma floridanum TaxID=29053 RepID=UPI000C6F6569|nr:uncharacterized protein LOC111643025 [Copidosoma floridanum]
MLVETWLEKDKWTNVERDWNARTGREGGWINESDSDDKHVRLRKSKDEKINEEGRRLIKEITEKGWCIVNGQKGEEGEFTYVGSRGESVIDYAIGCQEALDQIKKMKIGQRTESDHMPLEVYLENEVEVGIVEKEERTKARRDWTQELIDQYGERCKDRERKGKEIEERWSELKDKIDRAVPKKKKRYKNATSEGEVWKYINKYRKKRRRETSKKFTVEECRRYFMEKSDGKNEEGIVREETRKDEARTNAVDQEEMSKEEFERQIARLKVGKAPGEDKLENEVWKYMPGEVDAALWELLKKVWKKGELPDQWRQGTICLIHKKGDKDKLENYRGVTLTCTAYKIYASMLNEMLKKEIEGKLSESQFGFREKRGEAFDRVDRKVLKERLIEMEVSEKLRNRIMDIYKETRNVVKVGEEESKEFWTEKANVIIYSTSTGKKHALVIKDQKVFINPLVNKYEIHSANNESPSTKHYVSAPINEALKQLTQARSDQVSMVRKILTEGALDDEKKETVPKLKV